MDHLLQTRAHFSSGTGVTINNGEISIGQNISTTSSVQFGKVTSTLIGNVTGDVTGSVSDISNHDTGDLSEGSNLYHTTARARGSISVSDSVGILEVCLMTIQPV